MAIELAMQFRVDPDVMFAKRVSHLNRLWEWTTDVVDKRNEIISRNKRDAQRDRDR